MSETSSSVSQWLAAIVSRLNLNHDWPKSKTGSPIYGIKLNTIKSKINAKESEDQEDNIALEETNSKRLKNGLV